MSRFTKYITVIALLGAFSSVAAYARGPGARPNDAKYYGPVYGWRYYPPPAAVPEPVCSWTQVRVMRNGHAVTRRVRQCS